MKNIDIFNKLKNNFTIDTKARQRLPEFVEFAKEFDIPIEILSHSAQYKLFEFCLIYQHILDYFPEEKEKEINDNFDSDIPF